MMALMKCDLGFYHHRVSIIAVFRVMVTPLWPTNPPCFSTMSCLLKVSDVFFNSWKPWKLILIRWCLVSRQVNALFSVILNRLFVKAPFYLHTPQLCIQDGMYILVHLIWLSFAKCSQQVGPIRNCIYNYRVAFLLTWTRFISAFFLQIYKKQSVHSWSFFFLNQSNRLLFVFIQMIIFFTWTDVALFFSLDFILILPPNQLPNTYPTPLKERWNSLQRPDVLMLVKAWPQFISLCFLFPIRKELFVWVCLYNADVHQHTLL